MSNRVKIIEQELNIRLPKEYKDFINNIGLIIDTYEVYGYIESIDINKIPCVIGATRLYKKDYSNINEDEVVIAFDNYLNQPIILNTKNNIYLVDFDKKILLSTSFNEWLKEFRNGNQ